MSLPTPYYDDGNGMVIYHGDCREILPHLPKVDLVLTDPPYGIGEAAGKNKTRGLLSSPKDYGDDDWDNAPPPRWLFDWLMELSRYQIIFGGNYFGLPPSSCWLVWDKDNGSTDFADCELAWTNLSKAVRRLRWRWNGMLQENMAAKETRDHPTQKPLEVMKWCLEHVPSASTVLDPFMGSGTTLRAAKDLGRKCIGIELEEKYCEIAVRRLGQEVLNL